MERQTEYLQGLQSTIEANPAIKAAWLTGSYGRGNADRYSDVDLNLLLNSADVESFRQGTKAWLDGVRPLVLFNWMFNDRMANCLTADGLRLDLWIHTDTPTLDESRVTVLLDRERALQFGAAPSAPDPNAQKGRLVGQISEFWRCIALTPVAIGRDERLVSLFGITIEFNILSDVIISGYGIARDSGVKRLNPFLPEELRAKIEDAVNFDGLTIPSLIRANFALARIMQEEGRKIAAQLGFEYPAAVERAALDYTKEELALLGYAELVR